MKGAVGVIIAILLAYLCVVETIQLGVMKLAYDEYQEQQANDN